MCVPACVPPAPCPLPPAPCPLPPAPCPQPPAPRQAAISMSLFTTARLTATPAALQALLADHNSSTLGSCSHPPSQDASAASTPQQSLQLTLMQYQSMLDQQRRHLAICQQQAEEGRAAANWAVCELRSAALALSAALGHKEPPAILGKVAAAASIAAAEGSKGSQPGQLRALVSEHCRLAASAAQRLPEARDMVAHLREELGRQSAKAGASEASKAGRVSSSGSDSSVSLLRSQLVAARVSAKMAHVGKREAQQAAKAAAAVEEEARLLQRQLEVATGQLEQAVQQGEGLKGRLAAQDAHAWQSLSSRRC